jgi:hypothetical protein
MWSLLALGLSLRPSLDRRAALGAAAALAAPWSPLPSLAAGPAPIPSWDLGGAAMPTLALNTAGLSADAAERATRLAFSAGITHVDFHPGIERDGVARAIASSGRGPADFFLTTKIRAVKDPAVTPAQAAALARKQIEEDLAVLDVPRVDMLMLRDCPDCAVMQVTKCKMTKKNSPQQKHTRKLSRSHSSTPNVHPSTPICPSSLAVTSRMLRDCAVMQVTKGPL